MTEATALDLATLRGMNELQDLRITNGGAVKSARPLLEFPNLKWLRLGRTQILDGDLAPLTVLASNGVLVGGADQ
jgi:hypothetical protein